MLHGRSPWNTNECFFFLSLFFSCIISVSLFISRPLSLHLHPNFFSHFLIALFASTSTCFCPSLFLFSLSLCLFCVLPPLSFPCILCRCLSLGLSAAAGLSCAVICHTTEGKKHLLLMLPPSLSLFFGVSPTQAVWFLPSSQLSFLLLSTSPLLFLLKSLFIFPGGFSSPQNVRQLSYMRRQLFSSTGFI